VSIGRTRYQEAEPPAHLVMLNYQRFTLPAPRAPFLKKRLAANLLYIRLGYILLASALINATRNGVILGLHSLDIHVVSLELTLTSPILSTISTNSFPDCHICCFEWDGDWLTTQPTVDCLK
jgi:hypothetical protein